MIFLGLVSKIFPSEILVSEAVKTAQKIAGYSGPVTQMCKEAINQSQNAPLREGLRFERRLFQSTFALVIFTFMNIPLTI